MDIVMRLKTLTAAGVALLAVGLASSLSAETPTRSSPLVKVVPVRTVSQTVGQTLTVCMNRGARPSSHRVVTHSCRGGADYCTAWVELGDEEANIVLATYDLGYAPVEATGATCDQPGPPPSGVLGR